MARTKRRLLAHARGDRGIEIVRGKLPRYWVARELHPDYGLDLHIEVFEPEPATSEVQHADTLGEHFFAQVKTIASLRSIEMPVWGRPNVAKAYPSPAPSASADCETIAVAPCSLDTSELLTVEAIERVCRCFSLSSTKPPRTCSTSA